MGFLEAFADELVKTAAAPEGALHSLVRRLPGLAAVGGGGAALGYAFGRRKGERQGVAATGDVAQRAYSAGLERGAEEMRDAMLQAGGGSSGAGQ